MANCRARQSRGQCAARAGCFPGRSRSDCAADSVELWRVFWRRNNRLRWPVPVNPFARFSDYIHYLENSEPRAAIIHSNALAEFLPASSVRPQIPIVIVGEEKIDMHGLSCAKWSPWAAAASEQLAAASTSPHDPALCFTPPAAAVRPKRRCIAMRTCWSPAGIMRKPFSASALTT